MSLCVVDVLPADGQLLLCFAEIGNSAKQHETLNMGTPVPARFLKFTILSGWDNFCTVSAVQIESSA